MLLRSSACVCQHYASGRGLQLPMHWSPFAWLALVHEASQGGHELWQLCKTTNETMHACFLDHEDAYGEWSLIQVRSCITHASILLLWQLAEFGTWLEARFQF
jgi:hypothetical protein